MAKVTGADTVIRNLQTYDERYKATVRHALAVGGEQVTARMRADAPWQDRTGAARRGLHTDLLEQGSVFTLRAAHGVPYGIFLETAHQGRFRILYTLRVLFPRIMANAAREVKAVRAT